LDPSIWLKQSSSGIVRSFDPDGLRQLFFNRCTS
jgi:hypothetical protein